MGKFWGLLKFQNSFWVCLIFQIFLFGSKPTYEEKNESTHRVFSLIYVYFFGSLPTYLPTCLPACLPTYLVAALCTFSTFESKLNNIGSKKVLYTPAVKDVSKFCMQPPLVFLCAKAKFQL